MDIQYFKDTANQNKLWAFKAEVLATEINGVWSFKTATGVALELPTTLVPATAPAATAPSSQLIFFAFKALRASDTVVLRCLENAVPVPADWRSYRAALRQIISGADTTATSLPVQPSYPAGT